MVIFTSKASEQSGQIRDLAPPTKRRVFTRCSSSFLALLLSCAGMITVASAGEIPIQQLNMSTPAPGTVAVESLLPGEVKEVIAEHVSLSGPIAHEEPGKTNHETIFLFLSGRGSFNQANRSFKIDGETIARAPLGSAVMIDVPEGETVHYIRIRKELQPEDLRDMESYTPESRSEVYFKKFRDCQAYTEAIKSPKTVSRTLLPEGRVTRVAMGTVETIGPDEVGAHRHPMLDQLFLGLAENDVIVHADEHQAAFTAYSLLHIPLGATHWVTASEGRKLYYVWMDFFLSKEGQEWLKTHKPVDK